MVSAQREMPLLIGGPARVHRRLLLLIGAPDADDVVHVRVWSAARLERAAARACGAAGAFLKWLEEQSAAGRSMNQSLYALRLWLRGEGPAAR